MKSQFSLLLIFSLLVPYSAPLQAQSNPYPRQTIKLVSPIPAGGAPDLIARILGAKLAELTSQSVVIENHVGSNGGVAAEYVARSSPDGYTLLVCMDSTFTINPYLYRHSNIDVNKDLMPVATLGSNQFVLSANAQLPVKNFAEFIALAKKSSPPLAYASAGNGSQHHLIMELLKAKAGIDLLHIPYKGGSPATTATVGGETAVMFAGTSNASLMKSGKLRALASTGLQRSKVFPQVPTISETFPDFEAKIWIGLFAPQALPNEVLERLRNLVSQALMAEDLTQNLFKAGGIEPFITTPAGFKDLIAKDQQKYSQIIKAMNITLD